MNAMNSPLIRIGVFYDGNYFLKISDYYYFQHERKARISLEGLHEFICHQVAEDEDADVRLCQITEPHFFRGRLSATEAREKDRLFHDRLLDDILMNMSIQTHYMPLKTRDGRLQEKGVDVWLALEALELSMTKHLDVVVLIAGDSDYVPLIKKLNTVGTRVMLLSWDFKYTDFKGENRVTRPSQLLLETVNYAVAMNEVIDNPVSKYEPLVDELFVNTPEPSSYPNVATPPRPYVPTAAGPEGSIGVSTIKNLKNGYGFVVMPPNNLFFSYADMADGQDFNELHEGDWVEFTVGRNHRNEDCARNVRKTEAPAESEDEEYDNEHEPESAETEQL
ncbi:NYN domain-containing protein [Hymenobacter busanensis]|uniref:NYN domain-containing protein n=1 Tax=Hymenobacter busanensis TaxID=2607656 RepID=A0A7L4ZYB8_9BACT|nr:NYN domain-containing protein [Hymenobacter busanensis]KAA9333481.1 NYN domain-containing protein [Hymenobacter busanensis]QHJ07836.1 NYN domain-containing protein [Hymenobacter busanensis]